MKEKQPGVLEFFYQELVKAGVCVFRTEQFCSTPKLPEQILIGGKARTPEKGRVANSKVASFTTI